MNIIKSKIFRIILLFYIIGFILGIVSLFVIDNTVIENSIISYFDMFSGDINYIGSLINSFCFSFNSSFFIFISGLLIIGIIVIPLFIIFKAICDVLIVFSIIECFYIKGLIISFILCLFSLLFKDFIYLILSYYSFSISLKEFKIIKNNKMISFKNFYKNYFLRYIILFIFLILINFFEVYVLSNIIKYIII